MKSASATKLLLPVIHEPRHQYDCSRCKFNWNCGPLCACFEIIGPPPPPKRAREVARLQRAWRKSVGLE